MIGIRIHGRGGQGVVRTSELISIAALNEGKFCRGFPFYGSQRRGAPLVAFALICPRNKAVRSMVNKPTHLIILDPKLPKNVNVTDGLREDGIVVQNTNRDLEEAIGLLDAKIGRFGVVDATSIGLEYTGRPIPNTATLGAFAKVSEVLEIESVVRAIKTTFLGDLGKRNAKAAEAGYDRVKIENYGR